MTNADAIAQLTSLKGQTQDTVDALGVALTLLTTGYQSDQQAITDGIAAGVDAAVAVAVAPLNQQIADLTAQAAAPTPQS